MTKRILQLGNNRYIHMESFTRAGGKLLCFIFCSAIGAAVAAAMVGIDLTSPCPRDTNVTYSPAPKP